MKTHGGAGEGARKDHSMRSRAKNPLGKRTHAKARDWFFTSFSCFNAGPDFKD